MKSKNSSGSIDATSSASKLSRDERDRRRGGLAGVVPAVEGAHHHRVAQRRAVAPDHVLHRDLTVPDRVRPTHHDGSVATVEQTTIAELRAGSEVEGVFACTRKDRLTARSGSPYLAVELRDRTGAIRRARSATRTSWPASSSAATSSRSPAASSASATSSRSSCASIRRAEAADPAAFLPTAYRDLDELDGFLEHLAREVYDPDLRALLDAFLGDDGFRAELRRAPCTRSGPPRLPGRPARAHGRRGHAGAGDLRAAPAAQLGRADLRGAPARRRQDARVRAGRRDRAQRGGRACRPRGARPADDRRSARRGLDGFPDDEAATPSLHCVLAHHGAGRAAGPPLPHRRRRWRCTA